MFLIRKHGFFLGKKVFLGWILGCFWPKFGSFLGLKMVFGGGIGAKNRRNFAVLAEISPPFGRDISVR